MRRILVENARRKQRIRRGGGREKFDLDEAELTIDPPADDLLDLEEALVKLSHEDEQSAELVRPAGNQPGLA